MTDDDRRELLVTADESLQTLTALVTDLLDVSRVQAGVLAVSLAPVDASDVVLVVDRRAGPRVPSRSNSPSTRTCRPLRGDGVLLQRVVVNVLANAARYAPHGSRVRITTSRFGGSAEIRIIDQGPGVVAERRNEIFAPFQRLGDTDNTTGLGLGLALSKGFTEGMGGTLDRRGHTRRRTHRGNRAAHRRRRGRAKMKILLADDDPQIVRALRITLTAHGYDIVTADDGASAIAAAASAQPDIVMLDLGMPRLDGLQVIAALRGWTSVPILVVSGRTGAADKVDALDAGADDYVTKPFQMDELLARLRALTRRAHPPGRKRRRWHDSVTSPSTSSPEPVTRAGTPVRLTPTEWHVLEFLARHPGLLVSRQTLLTEIWGSEHVTDTGYLRLYIAQLRKKLEADPARPQHILTESGMGYRLVLDP